MKQQRSWKFVIMQLIIGIMVFGGASIAYATCNPKPPEETTTTPTTEVVTTVPVVETVPDTTVPETTTEAPTTTVKAPEVIVDNQRVAQPAPPVEQPVTLPETS